MNYFAKNISYLRNKKGVTQAEIPKYIDITRGTWSNYELSKAEPNIDQIVNIAQFLGVTVHELLCEDLEVKGNLSEKKETDKTGNLNSNGKGNQYKQNSKLSFVTESGSLTANSTYTEVINTINDMRADIDRLQRLKDK